MKTNDSPLPPRLESDNVDFRQLAENIREIFYIIDPSSNRLEYMSPAYYEVFGRDPNDLARDRDSLLNAVVPESQQTARAHMERRLKGENTEAEICIMRPNGERRWLLDRSFPVRDEKGNLMRVVGIAEDITEDKQRRERADFLAEASAILTGTLDFQETLRRIARLAVPRIADWCAVYIEDAQGRLRVMEAAHSDPEKVALALDVNRRFPPNPEEDTGVYGVHRSGRTEWVREITEEMLTRGMRDPEHLSVIRQLGLRSVMMVPLIAREQRLGVMAFIYAESGRIYDQDDVVFAEDLARRAAVAADNARLFEAAQQARNEAERRQREEIALRKATEAVAATFSVEEIIHEIAYSALQATDADGSFVERVQPEADNVVVVAVAGEMAPTAGDVIPFKGSVAELVLERKQPEIIRVLGQTEYPLPGTLTESYASGSALVVPLIDAGEAIGVLILLRRLEHGAFTEDEAQRAQTFGNLASLAFRKVHLLEASEQRSRELEEVMESRTRLVRGFSHDLKNPLGAADGHASLLEDGMLGDLTDQQKNSVGRIRAALKTAVALINDLVELARAESGQLHIKVQPVDVREIAREIVEQYRPAAEQAGLAIEGSLGSVEVVSTDADRVRQVLGNLLTNAVKYTKEGGRIAVKTGMRAMPGGTNGRQDVVIDVVDNGIGIPEDKVHLLFTEFARIDPSVRPGVGLGLAISRRIARLLGGDVTVETKRGTGSTFTLRLPVKEKD